MKSGYQNLSKPMATALLIILTCLYCWVSNEDYKEAVAAEQHKKIASK